MNLLLKIKDDVMRYAETISQILNIDVEVMDNSLTRIAGTGRLKEKVGLNMSNEAHIYKKSFKYTRNISHYKSKRRTNLF